MNENIALGIIQSSIIAAGLIFTVFTVLVPLLDSILDSRAENFLKKRNEVKNKAGTPEQLSSEDISELETFKDIPSWLSWGLIGAFILYLSSAMTSAMYLMDRNDTNNFPITIFFWSNTFFLLIGFLFLNEVKNLIKNKYKKMIEKKKLEEPKLF